jgi:hypothetical protein
MNATELKPGIIVRGPVLPEPIELLVVTPLGDVIKIVGAGQKTGQVHQRVLRLDQLQFLDATPEHEPFDGDPARFRLGVEAARLGLAYEYDPYFTLSISRVDPLPHQLEAVESGGAVPINAAAVKEVASTTSPLQPARYRRWRRYGWWGHTKCYREFVIGPYSCHWFPL